MLLSKLKVFALGAVAVTVAVGSTGWSPWSTGVAAPAPRVAAPVPAKRAGEGLLWLRDIKSGKLVALTPDGKVRRTVDAGDGEFLRGLSPADNKLWFAGRDGRRPDPNGGRTAGLTLHVREINDGAEGKDLGLEVTDQSSVSPDGRTLLVARIKQGGTADRAFEFENALVDIATGRKTRLDLPGNHQLFGVAPDGSWVLSFEYVFPPEKGVPAYRLHKTPAAGGKPKLLTGTITAMYGAAVAPDGRRLLVFGEDTAGKEQLSLRMSAFVIDVEMGKAARIAGDEKQLWSVGIWSPDGKRIAYAWRERDTTKENGGSSNGVPPTRVVVCDADGGNSATILTTDEFVAPVAWW
jgi:dipeptidyl aminopeptidase/acylaminoacyl peptidase